MNSNPIRLVFLAGLAHFAIELCSNFLPVVYPTFIKVLALSYAQVGTLALVAVAATSIPQLVFGYLSDQLDPSRLTVLSILWIGCVMGLVGFAQNYASVLFLVGIGMLGSALFHPPGAALASAGSNSRKGASMSVFSVGGNLGYALSPLLVTAGTSRFGLHGTAILIPLSLLLGLFLQRQMQQVSNTPEIRTSRQRNPAAGGFRAGLILITVMAMTRSWFGISFATYLPAWIESQGGSVAAGARMLFVFSMGSSFGSLAGGPLSDRAGRWQVLAVSMALAGPVLWLFLQGPGPFQAVPVALMGFLLGTTFPVAVVLAQETWPQGVGLAGGLVMGLGWLPGGIGSAVTGFIADHFSLAAGLRTLIVPPLLGAGAILTYAALRQLRDNRDNRVAEGTRLDIGD